MFVHWIGMQIYYVLSSLMQSKYLQSFFCLDEYRLIKTFAYAPSKIVCRVWGILLTQESTSLWKLKMAEGGNEKDDGMELAKNLEVTGENNQAVINSEGKSCFSLMVTSEQRDSIVELFDQNEWPTEENSQNDVSMDVYPDRFRIPHDDQCDECMNCYCKPCITSENGRMNVTRLVG